MPTSRRKQSNVMLYTLIIFVGLFIISATIAVFYYVKAEEYRTSSNNAKEALGKFASQDEQDNVGAIVGQTKSRASSYLGTMVQHLGKAVTLIIGGVPKPTSAEVLINDANSQAVKILTKSEVYLGTLDPNLTGLVQIIDSLLLKHKAILDANDQMRKNYNDLYADFKKTEAANLEAYQKLLAAKEALEKDVNDIKTKYDALSARNTKNANEQEQTYKDRLEKATAELKTTNAQLLKTQAVLTETKDMLASAKEQLAVLGEPKRDAMAYVADGQILSVDNDAKLAYINLGSNDHVYRGLTFAIYDKGSYIGQEGQDKAEIEIFDIAANYSAARIIKSQADKPILSGDMAANLIWDRNKTNEFVIAGDFDLNEDGKIDPDAEQKIKATIERWGGKVTVKISIDTDYLILGTKPVIREKPTLDEQEIDPTALQRYEDNLKRFTQYEDYETRAATLWIPVFTYEKFLHLIGYTGKAGQAGTF